MAICCLAAVLSEGVDGDTLGDLLLLRRGKAVVHVEDRDDDAKEKPPPPSAASF